MMFYYTFPPILKNQLSSYKVLADFSTWINNINSEGDVVIDFTNCNWFSANLLCSISSSINIYIKNNSNNVSINPPDSPIFNIWKRNQFAKYLGFKCKPSTIQDSTIDHKRYMVNKEDKFIKDFNVNVLNRKNMPNIIDLYSEKIRDSVLEIFLNVGDHTNSKDVYSCGQYFQRQKELAYSIVDNGETIEYNVLTHLNKHLEHYIKWALEVGNSTKNIMPRGLGFGLIRDFLANNNGKLFILSGYEYYEMIRGKEKFIRIDNKFYGTLVTMVFNLRKEFSNSEALDTYENIIIF